MKGSAVVTLDYSYREDSLCWIESRDLSSQLKCSKISKAGTLPEEWAINMAQYLHSEYWQCFSRALVSALAKRSEFGLAIENRFEALNIATHTVAILWFFHSYIQPELQYFYLCKGFKDVLFYRLTVMCGSYKTSSVVEEQI